LDGAAMDLEDVDVADGGNTNPNKFNNSVSDKKS